MKVKVSKNVSVISKVEVENRKKSIGKITEDRIKNKIVKVHHTAFDGKNVEHFWVRVINIKENVFDGIVDNNLIYDHGFDRGFTLINIPFDVIEEIFQPS